MEIATRAGQDSDCNPATAAGILCTMKGYDKISSYWLEPLKIVEDRDFQYTTISLNDVYDMGLRQAMQVIENNGGEVENDKVKIKIQSPEAAPLEIAFPNIYPVKINQTTPSQNFFSRRQASNLFELKSKEPIDISFSELVL